MEVFTGVLGALERDYWLWVAIFGVLYVFSLYIYFFPTPLRGEPFEPFEPFRNMPQVTSNPRKTTA